MSKGKIIIISGFSGVGKGTLIKAMMEKYPGKYSFSISATTRAPREGEVDGKDYFFITREEFESMISSDKLLEYTKYGENYYGTPVEQIEKLTSEGLNIILDIEVTGMHQVTKIRDDVLTVFVIPPTSEDLINRLSGRGTETLEQIQSRLNRAVEESKFAGEYACIIQNGDFDKAVDALNKFIDKEIQDKNTRLTNLILTQEICDGIKRYINRGE